MQTLLWQKLRFLKFINSFFNPFWWEGKGEKEKGWKVVKRVLPINEPLLQPFTWQRMAFVALLFQLFHGLPIYSFTAYSFLLSSLFLTSYSFSPYYSPLLSLFLPSLPLTPYYFSPYSFPAFSSNLSTSHCSCWAMVSCPLSSSIASSALRNGLTSRWLSL